MHAFLSRLTTAVIALGFALAICVAPVKSETCDTTGPDVIVGDLAFHPNMPAEPEFSNFSSSSGIEAFAVATYSCNIGTTWLNWLTSDTTGFPFENRHPVISQNAFKLSQVNGASRIEQLGQSWLKHGFYALSDIVCCPTCVVTDGSHLGVGCADPYNSARNSSAGSLGPKWQVNATTGVHTHPVANPSFSGSVARRLQVKIADLAPSDGTQPLSSQPRYYVEGQYIAADDAANNNKNNNASYRPITVSGSGTSWTFAKTGTTQRQQAGIRAWGDFDPTVVETDVVTPEEAGGNALVILAAQATDLGNGVWHYEYAVQNLNSDRSIGGFAVPISGYASVTNVGFRDVDYHSGDGIGHVNRSGTDWPATDWATQFAGEEMGWDVSPDYATNNNGNGLRWGTLYNFRFDANVAPTTGDVTLTQYKVVNDLTASSVVPAAVSCTRGDLNADGFVDGLDIQMFTDLRVNGGGSPTQRCAADVELVPDFSVDDDDIEPFAGCCLNAVCP